MPLITTGEVLAQQQVGENTFFLKVRAPEIAGASLLGQFVNLRVGESESRDPLLRRPLSLHGFDKEKGEIEFLYAVRGRGTAWLAKRREGEVLDLLGPLGNGFFLPGSKGRVALVGGGIGIAPLFPLAASLIRQGQEVFVFWGAKTERQLFRREAFPKGSRLEFATEDGSFGVRGLVTALLPAFFRRYRFLQVYACGPYAMLREVARLAQGFGYPLQVLVEGRMACGFGACLGCALKLRDGSYARVCTAGPVFQAEKVAWEDDA